MKKLTIIVSMVMVINSFSTLICGERLELRPPVKQRHKIRDWFKNNKPVKQQSWRPQKGNDLDNRHILNQLKGNSSSVAAKIADQLTT